MRFNFRLSSDRFDRRLAQLAFLCGAAVVFGTSVTALARLTVEPAELLIGGLAAASVAVGLTVLSFVVAPRATAG